MLKKRMKLFVVFVFIVAASVGIIFFFAINALTDASSDAVFSDSCNFVGTDGFIHQSLGQNGAYMMFDYKTRKNGYLWGNAAASSFAKAPTVLAEYKGEIYAQASYGANKSYIYKADRAGKHKETLTEVDSDAGGRILLMGGKLYYESTVHKVKDLTATKENTVSINSVDLKSGKVQRVSPIHFGVSASIALLGYYKNNIYYIYSSSSEQSNGKTIKNKHAIYEYNIKTQKERAIMGQVGSLTSLKFYKDSVYYMLTNPANQEVTLYRHHLDTEKDDAVVSDKKLISSIQCFDNKVFYRKTGEATGKEIYGFYYDIGSSVTKTVPVKYGNGDYLYLIGETPDMLIITHIQTDSGGKVKKQHYAYLYKSAYYAGKVLPKDFD